MGSMPNYGTKPGREISKPMGRVTNLERKQCTLHSCLIWDRRYGIPIFAPFPLTHLGSTANPTPRVQQSHPRASLPCPALRRKREENRQRPSWGIQEPRRSVCWYRRSSWEQQLQPAERRESVIGDGVQHGACWCIRCCRKSHWPASTSCECPERGVGWRIPTDIRRSRSDFPNSRTWCH